MLTTALLAVFFFLTYIVDTAKESGGIAPEFSLAAPDGSVWHSRQMQGRPYLVHFWASWCGPCREEAPVIEALGEQATDLGVTALAVAMRDQSDAVAKTGFPRAGTLKLLLDGSGRVAQQLGVESVPETLVIDGTGRIALRLRGTMDDIRVARVRSLLTKLSAKSANPAVSRGTPGSGDPAAPKG